MACRFVFLISLLTIGWTVGASGDWRHSTVGASGDWKYRNAKEARPLQTSSYKSGDGDVIEYVIAVGTEEKPETIQAERITAALLAGKEIRLKWVEIKGYIDFHAEIKQVVYFISATFKERADFGSATFSSEADFRFATFSRETYFGSATFSGDADFGLATFSNVSFHDATFSSEADFADATFSNADFGEATFSNADFADATFSNAFFEKATFSNADFADATFSSYAHFRSATFSNVSFSNAIFSGNIRRVYFISSTPSGNIGSASFVFATFSGDADFHSATFSGDADFRSAKFSEAYFGDVTFSGKTYFSFATFKERADFSNCRFKDLSHFVGCLYSASAKMNFSGVTGFSQMQLEWQYDPQWDVPDEMIFLFKDNRDKQKSGLRGRLEYDKMFYIALIKNYQDMGWLDEANDCYYTYRVEKRTQVDKDSKPRNSWYKRMVEYIVLDLPFGYGVKPRKLFRSFLILWILFSLFYASFLRLKEGESPCPSWTRHDSYSLLWAAIYSLHLITPGINLVPQVDSFTGGKDLERKTCYTFPHESEWVIWAQRIQQILGWYLLALFLVMFGKIWIR